MLKDIRQCFLNLSGSVMMENIINQMVSALQFLTVAECLKQNPTILKMLGWKITTGTGSYTAIQVSKDW